MSDALVRLTEVLNKLQDSGGLTANLKIDRSGALEIVITNADASPVTPSPPPAPPAEVPPGVRDAPPPPAPPPRDGAAAAGGRETPDGAAPPRDAPAGGAPPPPPGAPGAAEASKPVSSDVARALALAIAAAYSPADLLRHLPSDVLLEAVRLQRGLVGDPAEAAAAPEAAAPPEPAAPRRRGRPRKALKVRLPTPPTPAAVSARGEAAARRAAAEEAAEAPAAVAVAHGHGTRRAARAEAATAEPAAAPEAWWPLLRSLRDVAARSPQHDSWEEPEFIVQRRNAEHCRLLKSVSLSRDVCHGHGLVAVRDLEPGERFFDVTALYVDGAARKPGEGDCAACATGAHRRHTCGQGRSAGGGSYLPIDNSVYYELKAGPTHALTYFFNEDRRGDDCDARVRLQHTYVPRLGGWVLEWRVLERLQAGDELLVDYPETDDGVKHATWPARPPVAEKRAAPPAPKAPRAVTSRGRQVFAPASIEDSSSDDDDDGGAPAITASAGHEDAAALLALFAGAAPEPPKKKSRSGARRPAPPRVYKSRAEPPPPNPSNPWGLKRPPSVPRVPLNASFPRTLKLICEDPKNAAIVTWCPKAREISVVDKPTFITDVLPKYFRSNVASGRGKPGAVDDDTATAHFDGVHSRQFDSFVRQLNYYGFRKARRCTNRYVCMDYSIKSPAEFDRLSRYVPAHTASRALARAPIRDRPQPPPPALQPSLKGEHAADAPPAPKRPRGRPPGSRNRPRSDETEPPRKKARAASGRTGAYASPASPPDARGRLAASSADSDSDSDESARAADDSSDSDFEASRAPPPRPPVPQALAPPPLPAPLPRIAE